MQPLPLKVPATIENYVEFQVEHRAYLGQIPACNGSIYEFNLSSKSVTNNSPDVSINRRGI